MRINKIFNGFLLGLIISLVLISSVSAETAGLSEVRVTLLNQDPDPVEQGEVVEVRFKIENIGAETLADIKIEILPDYPFSIYTGQRIQEIGRLRASQTGADAAIVSYKLKVDENAETGDTEIELRVLKNDLEWVTYDEDEFQIDIETRNVPEIKAYIRETNILEAGKRGTITVEIANTDAGDAKFMQLTLLPSEDYQVLSTSNYIYIGDIDSDDTETEEFEIYVNKKVKDKLILPVQINYQDEDNDRYNTQFDLELPIFTALEMSRLGLKEKSYVVPIIVLIIACVSAYIYWKKKKQKKEM